MNSTRRWMQPVVDGVERRGIDGWRLDVANEVPTGFWREWNRFVRELNPEAYTVAEIWDEASDYLRDAGFSATMNYHAFSYPVKGFLIDNYIGPEAFAEKPSRAEGALPGSHPVCDAEPDRFARYRSRGVDDRESRSARGRVGGAGSFRLRLGIARLPAFLPGV
jgi:hypothetical protein